MIVSTKTAQQLKELGFNEPCYWYDVSKNFGEKTRNSRTNVAMQPDVTQVQQWLFDEYGIFITAMPVEGEFTLVKFPIDNKAATIQRYERFMEPVAIEVAETVDRIHKETFKK